jgi:dihydrofolate reductase
MAIIGIVAVDRKGAIGKGGGLPWHYSSDLKFFKQQTSGNACVMGHRTWRSLKRPLKERLNIVLSRTAEVEAEAGVIVLRDKLSVLSLNSYLACDLFIIGGAQTYESFLGEIDQWIVTEIPLSIDDAETFVPSGYLDEFKLSHSLELEEGLTVRFYQRASKESQPA